MEPKQQITDIFLHSGKFFDVRQEVVLTTRHKQSIRLLLNFFFFSCNVLLNIKRTKQQNNVFITILILLHHQQRQKTPQLVLKIWEKETFHIGHHQNKKKP